MDYIKTVGELINLLEQHPKDMKVEIVYETYAHGRIGCVKLVPHGYLDETVVQIVEYDP